MESEAKTRKTRIDKLLRQAGWRITPYSATLDPNYLTNDAVEEYPTVNGPADYALFVNGVLLGMVEAKKLGLGPQHVLVQAERYARGVESGAFDFGGFHAPFLYSTNGEVIWFHDVRHKLDCSRRITAFHTPAALDERLARDFAADWLVALCREVFERGESFVQKITRSATVDRPLQRIREFRNRPHPAIVVTVDMRCSAAREVGALRTGRLTIDWRNF